MASNNVLGASISKRVDRKLTKAAGKIAFKEFTAKVAQKGDESSIK